MPNKISKRYYPGSQNVFQDLLSKSSPLLSSALSSWVKKPTRPPWFNPLAFLFLHRSLSSFTRFLGENVWAMEEVTETALHQFFQRLRIRIRDVLFLIVDDTLVKKTGKKIPGRSWHKDHAQNMASVLGHRIGEIQY